ncbi:MAG TPA: mevalonate kinase [Nitrosopumilaceae archaeon]
MKSIASAPAKVILFGEHFVVYGIKAILCAIKKKVTVTSIKTDEPIISVKSNLGEITLPVSKPITEIKSPLLPFIYISKKMIDIFKHSGGIEITIDSDIPSGVGLGSSSACCVAAAGSISGLFTKYSKDEILNLAIEAEKTIFKDTSGADCTVCTYGGIMEYDKKRGFKKINTISELCFVIANSKIPHSTKRVVSKVKEFKEQNEKKFSELCEKESRLIEEVKIALKSHDMKLLGQAMIQNQKFLDQIGVSNEILYKLLEEANKTSFGSKITGAGDGGCIIALVDESNLENTLQNLQSKNHECFSVQIDSKGLDTF